MSSKMSSAAPSPFCRADIRQHLPNPRTFGFEMNVVFSTGQLLSVQ
jgi:hypothetical protein